MTIGVGPAPAAPVALYVHVPFCRSLCPYCDFVVVAGAAAVGPRSRVAAYLRAVAVELDLRADALDSAFGAPGTGSRPPLETVYLGGGTPSLLPAEAVAALLAQVRLRYGMAPGAEVTLEANPGPDDRGDLDGLAAAGITRLSIGAQSFHAGELRAVNVAPRKPPFSHLRNWTPHASTAPSAPIPPKLAHVPTARTNRA